MSLDTADTMLPPPMFINIPIPVCFVKRTTNSIRKMATKLFYSILLISLTINVIAYPRSEDGQPLIPAILVFGDSTVDTGNNNYYTSILSPNRANHRPYGRDFPTHEPTGRFSNGKLVPDFLAHTLDLKDAVPPFLDPGLVDTDLLTGVSFASGGSGYDDLTTVTTGAMPMSKQVDNFRTYKERISKIIGETEAKDLIEKALVIIFAGTNDFTLNYYD